MLRAAALVWLLLVSALWAAPNKDALWAAPNKDALWAAPNKDALWAAPNKDALWAAPNKDAAWAAPNEDAARAAPNKDMVARGAYLAHLGGCFACHTAKGAAPLAGGLALSTPFGTLYTPNITPDRATGIGAWSQTDFLRALRKGIRPDGSPLYPAFPYPSFARMSEPDALAIRAYLMAQPAVHATDRANALRFPYSWRPLLWVWRWLFFHPDPAQDATQNRGAYLVTAIAHCGECHTPRNFLGATIASRALSGTAHGPDNLSVPNITPDPATGIGGWSADDLVTLLTTGQTPEQDTVTGAMATAIADGLKDLSQQDARAIADYLLAQKPIVHRMKN